MKLRTGIPINCHFSFVASPRQNRCRWLKPFKGGYDQFADKVPRIPYRSLYSRPVHQIVFGHERPIHQRHFPIRQLDPGSRICGSSFFAIRIPRYPQQIGANRNISRIKSPRFSEPPFHRYDSANIPLRFFSPGSRVWKSVGQ